MGEPTDQNLNLNSMPDIPTFEPAPVPRPIVTDSMPPIPVTAPTPAPAPVKPAGMPVFGASQPVASAPAPNMAPAPSVAPVQNPTQKTPVMNPARMQAPMPMPQAPMQAPMQAPAPQSPMQQAPAPSQPINPALSAALESALRAEAPAGPATQANPNVNPMPAPNMAPAPNRPMPASMPQAPVFDNPFAEAMEKNREIRNVSFSSQDSRPIMRPANGDRKKRFIILGMIGGALLLIIVATIALAMTKQPAETPEPTPAAPVATNTPGDYLCEKEYLESEFEPFGDATAANTKVYFTVGENGLTKIRLERVVTYDDSDAVKAAFLRERDGHDEAYAALGLTEDPVSALYKRSDTTLKVNYNAAATNLTGDILEFFDIETTKAVNTLTSDDLQDLYEANNYTCNTAPVTIGE